jgi:serine/threonine protein phosphatase PrpC
MVAQLEAAGMKPDANFPWRHVVTRALGTQVSEPDVLRVPIAPGDVYLLCSDGLSEVLAPAQIAALLDPTQQGAPAEQACRALIDAAYAAGSRDNISAVVVRVGVPCVGVPPARVQRVT